MTASGLHRPSGSLATGPWSIELTADRAGWSWSSLRVLALEAGGTLTLDTGEEEMLALPLEGSWTVEAGGERIELAGRDGVFAGPTDFAYVGRRTTTALTSRSGGRLALPGARARRGLPCRYAAAGDTAIELRGAGSCSRQVNNLCLPGTFEADRLIVCEVLTPAANWSSYPPHKHDENRPGECELEEVYYFEVADGPGGPGMAYQRVYGTADRPIDVLAEVRSGDVVLVPHGWHGPSMAAPGYDLYYLNVMAGPSERSWLICDDPAHAWVRASWSGQDVDARLPFYGASEGGES
ncbi:MAG TPA: 5-deoxy-glucuronate isomerase [Acidimicrobiales bacterium]|nr:5-deoxy-glucuronate isomerase [Acidimicrobiales bacterium]